MTTAVKDPTAWTVEQGFAHWKYLHLLNEAAPETVDCDWIWDIVDPLEIAILDSAEASPRVAEIRLWLGLQHKLTDRADCLAAMQEDIDSLLANEGLDWDEKMTVHAIRALREGR